MAWLIKLKNNGRAEISSNKLLHLTAGIVPWLKFCGLSIFYLCCLIRWRLSVSLQERITKQPLSPRRRESYFLILMNDPSIMRLERRGAGRAKLDCSSFTCVEQMLSQVMVQPQWVGWDRFHPCQQMFGNLLWKWTRILLACQWRPNQ